MDRVAGCFCYVYPDCQYETFHEPCHYFIWNSVEKCAARHIPLIAAIHRPIGYLCPSIVDDDCDDSACDQDCALKLWNTWTSWSKISLSTLQRNRYVDLMSINKKYGILSALS